MSAPNGQMQEPGEPVNYADVLEYWRGVVMDLHSRLSVAAAQIKNRDQMIEHLRSQASNRSEQPPSPLGD